VAALGGRLDGGTPRVPEPEQPGGLVECLAHRVVPSPAKASVLAWSPCQVEARVAARDDEPQEGQRHRLVWRAVEVHGKQMPLEMVDADQPEVASLGDALRQRETDEQGPAEAGPARRRDPFIVRRRQARPTEGAIEYGRRFAMLPAGGALG